MKSTWLHRDNNQQLILFFNGWGMDEIPFRFLKPDGYDVVMFHDYRNLNLPDDLVSALAAYPEKSMLAWSMGVWAASRVTASLGPFRQAVAINGTPRPIDDRYGIPTAAFRDMMESLSPPGLLAFTYQMFTERREAERFLKTVPARPFEERRDELTALYSAALTPDTVQDNTIPISEAHPFTRAIVSSHDQIFPTVSQLIFWKKQRTPMTRLDAGHFPFYRWNSWKEILS